VTGQQALDAQSKRRQSIADIVRLAQMEVMTYMGRLDAARLVESWLTEVLPGAQASLTAGQRAAAAGAGAYVAEAARAMGLAPEAAGSVSADAFAGSAADGRPLATMLTVPALRGRLAIEQRAQSAEWVAGQVRQSVALMTASEIEDAGRAADSVGMAATRSVVGYIRVVGPGACARCAILAGRWYRYNADFLRHKHCQCRGVPAGSRASARLRGGWQTSPTAYFHSLSRADQARLFTVVGARAIRDGADIYQVVNARRTAASLRQQPFGRQTILTTAEGTTRRGLYSGLRRHLERVEGRSLGKLRLTPDAIYDVAEDRDEVLRLLARNGYLNMSAAQVAAL
jgi:hypothetical protein